MSPRRLSRKEKQAHTRECLLHSAARVFARRGVQAASVDEIASDAGFTKGAVYANFESKEALFLAMLDERFARHTAAINRIASTEEDAEEQVRAGGMDFGRYIADDPEWERLFFEAAGHAARNETFRTELVSRYGAMRDVIASVYRRRAEELGLEPPIPVEQIAMMTFAMANGFALEKLLEPDAVDAELYGTMLAIFVRGLRAMAEDGEPVAAS
jgi:AcrR family transcriptional regulator